MIEKKPVNNIDNNEYFVWNFIVKKCTNIYIEIEYIFKTYSNLKDVRFIILISYFYSHTPYTHR